MEAIKEIQRAKTKSLGTLTLHNYSILDYTGEKISAVIDGLAQILPDHGIFSIIFREDKPTDMVELLRVTEEEIVDAKTIIYGHYCPIHNVIIINLSGCFGEALYAAKGAAHNVGLRALVWIQMIKTIAHEMRHGHDHNNGLEWSEEKAEGFGSYSLTLLAQVIGDMEPPSGSYMDTLVADQLASFKDVDEAWAKTQLAIADRGLTFISEEGIKVHTLRDYLRLSSDDPDAKEWRGKMPVADVASTLTPEQATQEAAPGEPYEVVDEPIDYGFGGGDYINALAADEATREAAEGLPATTEGLPAVQTEMFVAPAQRPACQPHTHNAALISKAVFLRIFAHVFGKCGYNPQSQVALNGFEAAGNVVEGIRIDDIPGASDVFVKMTTFVAGSLHKDIPVTDQVSGYTTKEKGIPIYSFQINKGDGHLHNYRLLAQNIQTGSSWAQRSMAGHCILMGYREGHPEDKGKPYLRIELAPGQALDQAYFGATYPTE